MNRSMFAAAIAALVIVAPVFSQTDAQPAVAQRRQAAAAQRRQAATARQPQMQLRRLSKALNLSSDQIEKVKELMKAETQKVLRIRTDAQKKIRAILTPEQIKKYEEILKARVKAVRTGANAADETAKPKRAAGNAATATATTPAVAAGQKPRLAQRVDQLRELAQALGLTKDQQDLIKPILKAQAALLKTVREDTQKKLVAILTPEQAEKYKAILDAQKAAIKQNQADAEKPKAKAVKPAKRNKTNSGF